jgi:hypothetical protein
MHLCPVSGFGVAGVQHPAADDVNPIAAGRHCPIRHPDLARSIRIRVTVVKRFPFDFDAAERDACLVLAIRSVIGGAHHPSVIGVRQHVEVRVMGVMRQRIVFVADSRWLTGAVGLGRGDCCVKPDGPVVPYGNPVRIG